MNKIMSDNVRNIPEIIKTLRAGKFSFSTITFGDFSSKIVNKKHENVRKRPKNTSELPFPY